MSTSGNEDQNQRNTPVMEDSPSMTIEFLRARLLSERSISRTARQRADELAKRVAELEKELKIVTLQRKKAEKATETVLAILENHGVGDASDDFDSSSDQGTALCESNVSDSKYESKEEPSMEVRDNNGETYTYSSSEIDSSPFIRRNLSWKSDRESPHSSSRKKYTDSSRRSSSSGSSSKHVGKSCRRIRRRETISAVEGTLSPTGVCEHHANNGQLEFPACQILENKNQGDNGNINHTHEGDKDMEKALQDQAELIGQYEAEERAQREWEEKYTEVFSFMPDSRDLGNHSDVTEERDDMKASDLQSSAKIICSRDDESKPERVDRLSSEVQDDFLSPAIGKMKCNKTNVSESSSTEFAFPVSNSTENNAHTPPYGFHHSSHLSTNSPNPIELPSSSSDGTSGGKYELSLVLHETNKSVQNVLDALEQAKLSLRGKLNGSPQIEGLPSVNAAEPSMPPCQIGQMTEFPLFRLPTDLQWDTTPRAGYSYRSTGIGSDMFPRSHFMESTSTTSAANPLSSVSTRFNFHDPQPSGGFSFPNNHTFSPAMMPPSGGFSATFPVRENEFLPSTRFSPYDDDHIRPHMYR